MIQQRLTGFSRWFLRIWQITSRWQHSICANTEAGLAFETVFKQDFKKTFSQFRHELRRFDGRSDSLRAVQEVCMTIPELMVRRNDRIHARVRLTQDGYALYDWRTHRRLEISREQIEQKIELAIKAIVALEAHIPHLVDLQSLANELDRFFGTLPGLSGSDDIQTNNDPA